MNARRIALAVLALCAPAYAANPPNVIDPTPTAVVPAPVDMLPKAAPAREPEEAPPPRASQPVAKPSEPSANPLWAVPLSRLTATRERPLFSPSRRVAQPVGAVVATIVAAPPPAPSDPEGPRLTLVGAISSDSEGLAVFLDRATNSVIRLRTGQNHQGWVLRAVKGREATLEKANLSTTLMLPEPGALPGAPTVTVARPNKIRTRPDRDPKL